MIRGSQACSGYHIFQKAEVLGSGELSLNIVIDLLCPYQNHRLGEIYILCYSDCKCHRRHV